MYEMNLQKSRGFYRHIFNLNECGRDASEQFNSNNSQSHIERTQIERNMFDNKDDDTKLETYWTNALREFDHPKSRNYAFMFHVLSPSAYAMEQLIGEHESQHKLNNALILSSFEGSLPREF